MNSHSSRHRVTTVLKQPTRIQREPHHRIPIWSCSRWGLPCRSVTELAVRSYRTISPLPNPRKEYWRYLSVALSVDSRRPGVTWHLALWSRTFLGILSDDATVQPTSPPPIITQHLTLCLPRNEHTFGLRRYKRFYAISVRLIQHLTEHKAASKPDITHKIHVFKNYARKISKFIDI